MIVGEIEKDLELLGLRENNSPSSDTERNVPSWARPTVEDWDLEIKEAEQPPFSLTSGLSKQSNSWKNKCPVCLSTKCSH